MTRGQVHVYTGDGKGKTTAAMGLALRALGSGKKVVIVQFLKGGKSGEIPLLEQLGATVYRGKAGQKFVFQMTPEEKAGLCPGGAVPRLGLPALRVNGLHSQESAGGVCFPSACAAAGSSNNASATSAQTEANRANRRRCRQGWATGAFIGTTFVCDTNSVIVPRLRVRMANI